MNPNELEQLKNKLECLSGMDDYGNDGEFEGEDEYQGGADEGEWEHDFKFPPNDERENDEQLKKFRESCSKGHLHRRISEYNNYLKERIEIVESKVSVFSSVKEAYGAHLGKLVTDHPLLIAILFAVILAFSICSGLFGITIIMGKGFFGTFILYALAATAVFMIWALPKALPDMIEAADNIKDCRNSYEDDKSNLSIYTHMQQVIEKILREMVEDGGVPEEYWDYGGLLWQYVYDYEADTRSEALLCLTRDLRQKQMEHQIEEMGN